MTKSLPDLHVSLADWRFLARIGNAASDDEARTSLTKLHLKQVKGDLIAEATDSYIAARGSIEVDDPSEWEVLVSARQAQLVEKDVRSLDRYRSKKEVPDSSIILRLSREEEWLDVTLSEDGTLYGPESITRRLETSKVAPADGGISFPKLNTLLNRRRARVELPEIMFAPDLVARIVDAAPEGAALRFQFGKDAAPIRVFSSSVRIWRGVLQQMTRWPQ